MMIIDMIVTVVLGLFWNTVVLEVALLGHVVMMSSPVLVWIAAVLAMVVTSHFGFLFIVLVVSVQLI